MLVVALIPTPRPHRLSRSAPGGRPARTRRAHGELRDGQRCEKGARGACHAPRPSRRTLSFALRTSTRVHLNIASCLEVIATSIMHLSSSNRASSISRPLVSGQSPWLPTGATYVAPGATFIANVQTYNVSRMVVCTLLAILLSRPSAKFNSECHLTVVPECQVIFGRSSYHCGQPSSGEGWWAEEAKAR